MKKIMSLALLLSLFIGSASLAATKSAKPKQPKVKACCRMHKACCPKAKCCPASERKHKK